jgi:flagellar biosynthesis protein FlhB
MADTPDRDEKTEAPTPRRKQKAVEQGDVLQSRELGTALVILSGAAWLALAGPWTLSACRTMLAQGLTFDSAALADFAPGAAILRLAGAVVLPLATLFALTLVAAIGTPAMLGSLGFRWSAVGFKPNKLNPASGLKRIFGMQGLIELGKSLGKVVLLGMVAYWLLASQAANLVGLGRQDIQPALAQLGHVFVLAVVVMGVALAAIAGFDVPMQVVQRLGRLRMTKQEIKDEYKESEGSPENKAAQKRRAREVLSNSARKAIPQATVVLTNPTHFAVALRYSPGFDAAPIVVAKGKDDVARAIRELADEHAVPMLSYPQLARALYFTARPGEIIREDLYIAVATVLAFVFNLDRAMAEGTRQPEVEVPTGARFDEHGATTS